MERYHNLNVQNAVFSILISLNFYFVAVYLRLRLQYTGFVTTTTGNFALNRHMTFMIPKPCRLLRI